MNNFIICVYSNNIGHNSDSNFSINDNLNQAKSREGFFGTAADSHACKGVGD